ncbi:MAG: amidase [Alphaproteobacteria bacterium]
MNTASATEIAEAIAGGTTTAEEIVRDCLARIEEREPRIHAWHVLDADGATARARALDRSPRQGPLHGVPIGVKDIFDTVDLPTAYGSPIYRGHTPPWDASCVAMVRRAGAIVLGKTVSTEFAYFTPGPTANPHNPAHTPGGSSSGSAAAVADAMAPLAFGSQTAGSVIRPASFCGIVGFKASHGWHSLAGTKELAHSLDTLGWFARTIDDIALMRAALLGIEPEPLGMPGTPPRIGLCRTCEWPAAEPAVGEALEGAARAFADAGAPVVEVTLPEPFRGLTEAQRTIMAFEAARAFAYERTHHEAELSSKLRDLIATGSATTPSDYGRAVALAQNCRSLAASLFEEHDVLLTPSAPGEAPAGLEQTGDPVFNRMWTLLHLPAINLPGFTGPGGLPIGVQAIGAFGADGDLLRHAKWMSARIV